MELFNYDMVLEENHAGSQHRLVTSITEKKQ